jgi:hypothetical protein
MLFLKVVADYTPGKNTFQHLFSVYVVLFFLIASLPHFCPSASVIAARRHAHR